MTTRKRCLAILMLALAAFSIEYAAFGQAKLPFAVVDTGQDGCYDDSQFITCPPEGQAYYGQDAQFLGDQPSYMVSADGRTVYDNVTGLTWTRSPDTDGDGNINVHDKLTAIQAANYAAALNGQNYGGRNDWRVPSLKELYSLIDFRGTDPPPEGLSTSGLQPFIDDEAFGFAYGDTSAGERIIDAQFLSATAYVGTVFNGQSAIFGVNFADGRIKGYPSTKSQFVYFVSGNTDYGKNNYIDNNDGTITDNATGLMWSQADSAAEMNWEDALAWARHMNAQNYLNHNDWRLPNAKELQSIVDYDRSPDTTGSPAIDPIFTTTQITNETGQPDYPFYWSSTTHLRGNGSAANAAYVAFGRGLGSMDGRNVIDVHGAGCQRSDPKDGDPAQYPSWGFGSQGDVRRVFNYVRLVRDAGITLRAVTNAASYVAGVVAPGAIASLFGQSLSVETASASSSPLPTTLGGAAVAIKDSTGTTHECPAFMASPGQFNFLVPSPTATGQATLSLRREDGTQAAMAVQVNQVAPGLFSLNATGQGVGAILTLRVSAEGARAEGEAFVYDPGSQTFAAQGIDLGNSDDRVYLLLFGTGLRGYSDLSAISATIGGVPVPIVGAAPQSEYRGLDQVNIGPLPSSLAGRGELPLELSVDGVSANVVTIKVL